MADVNSALAATRAAVTDLGVAAERTGATWSTPRAPGKWSPSQLVEHVARSLEESANQAAGAPSKFPNLPAVLRPVVRGIFFNKVLKNGAFPKAKTSKAFNPASGAATPAEGRVRLEAAFARFEQECRSRAAGGQAITDTLFGKVSVDNYARFHELHVRHHRAQLPVA